MKYLLCLTFVLSIMAPTAHAAVSPVSFGIAPPVQFPPSDFTVTGVRVSALWGRHRNIYGIDIGGIGNITDGDFTGLAIAGGFNLTHQTTNAIGMQAAGFGNFNTNKATVTGIQLAGIINKNDAESAVNGVQFALVNMAEHTTIRGLQVGVYNRAGSVYGLQLGLVNRCDNLHGLQIGLINFHHKGTFVVSPILNFGF
ncbi:MAG: hypothetical protein AB7F86_11010 [Bdellovibrionales bacterium]